MLGNQITMNEEIDGNMDQTATNENMDQTATKENMDQTATNEDENEDDPLSIFARIKNNHHSDRLTVGSSICISTEYLYYSLCSIDGISWSSLRYSGYESNTYPFVHQFDSLVFDDKRYKYEQDDMINPCSYEMFLDNRVIDSLDKIPSAYQLANNLFKAIVPSYKPESITSRIKFNPLIIREDGWCLCVIESIKVDEIHDEPPNFGMSGMELKVRLSWDQRQFNDIHIPNVAVIHIDDDAVCNSDGDKCFTYDGFHNYYMFFCDALEYHV